MSVVMSNKTEDKRKRTAANSKYFVLFNRLSHKSLVSDVGVFIILMYTCFFYTNMTAACFLCLLCCRLLRQEVVRE